MMKPIINSLFTSFSLYSRIPVPQTEWKEENRRYVLSFFPLVGAVIGVLQYLNFRYSGFVVSAYLTSLIAVLIPVAVTGGIHLDGFCDVCDAKASFAPKEKKIEIMHDPHIGSFAVISLCLYFISQLVLFENADNTAWYLIIVGYVLSRALSGVAVFTFSCISTGMLETVNNRRKTNLVICIIWALICSALMIYIYPLRGAMTVGAALLSFAYYYFMSRKHFGGINGDLAGWFLQVCEICICAAAVISGGTLWG